MNLVPEFVARVTADAWEHHYYLSQPEASPCVDAGSDLATNVNLAAYTTDTDLDGDTGDVDMGYHISGNCNSNGDLDTRDAVLGVATDCELQTGGRTVAISRPSRALTR